METAKVDIRKLQILNDRINQAIEALGQLRLSVHGLQHSAPAWSAQAHAQTPIGYPQASIGYGPTAVAPQASINYGPVGVAQQAGIGYAPIGVAPQPSIGYGAIGVAPQPSIGYSPISAAPQTSWAFPFAGLAHSTPEAAIDPRHAQDPYAALRIAQDPYASIRYLQTFPYLYAVVPPVSF